VNDPTASNKSEIAALPVGPMQRRQKPKTPRFRKAAQAQAAAFWGANNRI